MNTVIAAHTTPNAIVAELEGKTKADVIERLAATILGDLDRSLASLALRTLHEREQLGSTGTGDGVAIPHGKVPGFPEIRIAFGRHRVGVDFGAADGIPADLIFLVLGPPDQPAEHLKTLAAIARLTRQAEVRARLREAADAAEILSILAETPDT